MVTNLQIKFIKSLFHKKYREINKLFIVEGEKSIEELIKYVPQYISFVYTSKDDFYNKIPKEINKSLLSKKILTSLSNLSTPPCSLAVVKYLDFDNKRHSWINIYLDRISDPGNLGTIFRTLDWYGVKNIFLSKGCVDIYNSKVVQASMGSLFRLNIEENVELIDLISSRKIEVVFGALMDGKNVKEIVDIPNNSLLILGNEANGIESNSLKFITEKISIKRYNSETESLNVSIATAIIIDNLQSKLNK